VGSVRIGVARSDPDGLLAVPVETVAAVKPGAPRTDLARIDELIAEFSVIELIVGLPRSLSGGEGPSATKIREYATGLARHVAPIPVRLVDERLTTVSATRELRQTGMRGRRQRSVVDQAAAVVILQNALDTERATGRNPGREVRVVEDNGT
jgi:putative holliday junction resolvase